MMGGELSEPGQGSRFGFELDLVSHDDADRAPWINADVASIHGTRVLVVDDNATNRTYLDGLCKSWGLRCDLARNGEQALAQCRAALREDDPYALILLDRMMPGMSGLEVLEALSRPTARSPTPR
jgi:two-component system sensor histidine kinase/response regulator